jgi:hypothetical protein
MDHDYLFRGIGKEDEANREGSDREDQKYQRGSPKEDDM